MEQQYKLTIAIPTYNRAKMLRKTLNRLCDGLDFNQIEVLVSDNASSDNTEAVVSEIRKAYPEIQYFRNDQNLGFDGNFLNCFKRASGSYVWLLSDDDILLDGAIESVIRCLDENPVCIHLNFSPLHNEEPLIVGKPRYRNSESLRYYNRNDFLDAIGIFCTFVSSLIFRTDLVRQIPNKEKYFGTNILQSHILFETMSIEGLYLINIHNCLAERGNKSVGYDLYRTWIKNYSDLLLITGAKCGFDEIILRKRLHKDLKETIYSFVIHFRGTCKNEKEWDKDCVWKYVDGYRDLKLKYRIAIYFPVKLLFILDLYNKICRLFKKIKKGI